MNPTLTLVAILVVVVGLVTGGVVAHHRGYRAGQAEREAYYAPLLRAETAAKLAADQRANELDAAADAATKTLEERYARENRILNDRTTAAESRFVDLLRQRSAGSCTGRESVPETSGAASGAIDTSGSDDRVGRLAASLAGVGGRCESDAARLARWEEWYRTQQALEDHAVTRPH